MITRHGYAVKEAILHCAAVSTGWTAAHSLKAAVAEIDRWHRNNGWDGIGYHYVVHPTGDYMSGRSLYKDGAHTAGHNTGTLGILLLECSKIEKIGQFADYFTPQQHQAVMRICALHDIQRIRGHNDYANKYCPGFYAEEAFPTLGH